MTPIPAKHRRVTLTIEPADGHHDILSIQDAFQQAIDFFNLLTDDSNKHVVWKLHMAGMNSPFSCEGEPVDTRTGAGAHGSVEGRIEIVARNLSRIAKGEDFDDAFPRDKVEITCRMLRRNTNGIGRSVMAFATGAPPVEISQDVARKYLAEIIAPTESLHDQLFAGVSHKEVGSVEGRLVEIGRNYDRPALQLEEHNAGGRVWCRISPAILARLASDMKAGDVWKKRRIRVRGTLIYNDQGNVVRVLDGDVEYIDAADVDLNKIEDAEFTDGYPVTAYLDRLREGEFGR